MSEVFEQKRQKALNFKKIKDSYEENQKILTDKEGKFDPSSLLSKDLLNQINSLEDIKLGEKNKMKLSIFHWAKLKKKVKRMKKRMIAY